MPSRPDGVESLEPREEVGLLSPRPRQALVEVVVRVDEPGRDERTAEVGPLVRVGLRTLADGFDQAVADQHPAAGMLAARLVHGHHVYVPE